MGRGHFVIIDVDYDVIASVGHVDGVSRPTVYVEHRHREKLRCLDTLL